MVRIEERSAPEFSLYIERDQSPTLVPGRSRAATNALRAAWIARDDLPHYLLTEGTLPVIEKAFNRMSAILERPDPRI